MTEELLRVKRGAGCGCFDIFYHVELGWLIGMWEHDHDLPIWSDCPHGSVVERIPERLVKCGECEGRGDLWVARGDNPRESECIACFYCLGTGLRLAKTKTETDQPERRSDTC